MNIQKLDIRVIYGNNRSKVMIILVRPVLGGPGANSQENRIRGFRFNSKEENVFNKQHIYCGATFESNLKYL